MGGPSVLLVGGALPGLEGALRKAGAADVSAVPQDIATASHVAVCGTVLDEAARGALSARTASGLPTLFIGTAAEALFGTDAHTAAPAAVPQWAEVMCDPRCKLLKPQATYFFSSPVALRVPAGWSTAWATLDGHSTIASAEKDGAPGVAAANFDVHTSGTQGRAYLAKWLAQSPPAQPTTPAAAAPQRIEVGALIEAEADVPAAAIEAAAAQHCDHICIAAPTEALLGSCAAACAEAAGVPLYAVLQDGWATPAGVVPLAPPQATPTPGCRTLGQAGRVVLSAPEGDTLPPSPAAICVPPAAVSLWKSRAVAAGRAVRCVPSGLQYKSTNLQCVVPAISAGGAAGETAATLAAAVDRFSIVGTVVVEEAADTDAPTKEALRALLKRYEVSYASPALEDAEAAMEVLNQGAATVQVASAAFLGNADELSKIPRERIVASLTAEGASDEKVRSLAEHVGGFVVDCTQAEVDLLRVADLARLCASLKAVLSVRLAACTAATVGLLDELGVECVVPAAQFTAAFPLATAVTAIVKSDRTDDLIPTVVASHGSGKVLGVCYSNKTSLREAVERRRGIYWSRNRGLWVKGETSGDVQELVRVDTDCDRDCLLFTVRQTGAGFCHRSQQSCFGPAKGFDKLVGTLQQRLANAPEGSYTKRLFDDSALLKAKLMEEAEELADSPNSDNCSFEAADLIYFALTRCVAMGVDLNDIQRNLDFKNKKVYRRKGDAKPKFIEKVAASSSS